MITASIIYPDAFECVDLIVRKRDFEKAKKIIAAIIEKIEADPKFAEKFIPRTDFMIELGKDWIESCVLRVTSDNESDDQNSNVADYFVDLDK